MDGGNQPNTYSRRPVALIGAVAMASARLRECIDVVGWTQRGLVRVLGRHEGSIRQWACGVVQMPGDVALWFERLAECHQSKPPPIRIR